jgi:methyl-accepting chemotaxis protein
MGRYRKNLKRKSFEKEMMDTGRIPNIVAALIISVYTICFAGISVEQLGKEKIIGMIVLACLIIFIMQFGIAPRTNHIVTRKIADILTGGNFSMMSAADRTDLVAQLMHCPLAVGIQVVLVFSAGVGCWIASFYCIFHISVPVILFSLATCLYGAINTGVLAYTYAERLCTQYACQLVRCGVDDAIVRKRHFFGPDITHLVLFYIIIPVFFTNILQFAAVWKGYELMVYESVQLYTLFFIIFLNTILSIALSGLLYKRIVTSVRQITVILDKMNNGELSSDVVLQTNLGDETGYNLYLANGVIQGLRSITDDAEQTGRNVFASTHELSVSSKETAVTSVEQAAGIKECVSTMEDAASLSHDISSRISDVTAAAAQTSQNVAESFSVLTENMQKMTEITEANLDTITGIKTLSEKIENIWSVVTIINSIADKTRIIAFNAELEASAAGESGQNFHIVANEIRRLAESITDSTREIRNRITEIQHSSDNLIIMSEGGTEKIREGSELFVALEDKFRGIRSSSEITAESALEIQQIIDEQSASFIQIVTTLQQISAGIDNFSSSTQTISNSAEELRQIAAKLQSLQPQTQG